MISPGWLFISSRRLFNTILYIVVTTFHIVIKIIITLRWQKARYKKSVCRDKISCGQDRSWLDEMKSRPGEITVGCNILAPAIDKTLADKSL